MSLAVIVVNYNDENDTLKYIHEIKEYDVIDRIVVVDNFSTNPGEYERLQELENDKI